jgi:hypothetical protein
MLPNTLPNTTKPSVTHVTLPLTYSRLYAEDLFLDPKSGLGAMGMTRKGFRALCKALSVPTIEVGNTRLVDALSFSLAMRSVLRLGQPDFLAPGCLTLQRGRRPKDTTTHINQEDLRGENLEVVLLELIAARKLSSASGIPKIRKAAAAAAERMRAVGFLELTTMEQDIHASKILETADTLDDLP